MFVFSKRRGRRRTELLEEQGNKGEKLIMVKLARCSAFLLCRLQNTFQSELTQIYLAHQSWKGNPVALGHWPLVPVGLLSQDKHLQNIVWELGLIFLPAEPVPCFEGRKRIQYLHRGALFGTRPPSQHRCEEYWGTTASAHKSVLLTVQNQLVQEGELTGTVWDDSTSKWTCSSCSLGLLSLSSVLDLVFARELGCCWRAGSAGQSYLTQGPLGKVL